MTMTYLDGAHVEVVAVEYFRGLASGLDSLDGMDGMDKGGGGMDWTRGEWHDGE